MSFQSLIGIQSICSVVSSVVRAIAQLVSIPDRDSVDL